MVSTMRLTVEVGTVNDRPLRMAEVFSPKTLPAASISGFYFGHPESKYFGVGRLDRDQVEDYAKRAGLPQAEAEKWLAPWLAYDV